MTAPRRWPAAFHAYRAASAALAPLLGPIAARKHRAMGADPARAGERQGRATLPRPDGRLTWVTAASLGELRAAEPVIAALGPGPVLVTTTSQSAAALAADVLPPHALHQFAPLDTPRATRRFLAHWRPDLAVFIESELPLRAVDRLSRAGTPMAWLGLRPSRTRQRFPATFAAALSRMALIAPQDSATADELTTLGAQPGQSLPPLDLKRLAPPLLADEAEAAALATALGDRPIWLVLSLHPNEAPFLAAAWSELRRARPEARLVIAPRHPAAAGAIAKSFEGQSITLRSQAAPSSEADIYIADTTGETGTLLDLAPFATIGGTFAKIGGHSPHEALGAGRPVVHGPHPGAHAAAFAEARAAGCAIRAETPAALARVAADWMAGKGFAEAQSSAEARAAETAPARAALARRLKALLP